MQFSFDLISDLHLETWPEFNWEGQATSQFCIVAGDVSKNYQLLSQGLSHLSDCYKGVFYIDGNDEHKQNLNQIGENYKKIPRKQASTWYKLLLTRGTDCGTFF